MPSLNMSGPYDLTKISIDANVRRTSPGNYVLGKVNDEGTFIVNYVGRSDTDVVQRLSNYIGHTKYKKFKFSYASSPKAAFEKECQNYHDFDGKEKLDNATHPQRPDASFWKCPVSGCVYY